MSAWLIPACVEWGEFVRRAGVPLLVSKEGLARSSLEWALNPGIFPRVELFNGVFVRDELDSIFRMHLGGLNPWRVDSFLDWQVVVERLFNVRFDRQDLFETFNTRLLNSRFFPNELTLSVRGASFDGGMLLAIDQFEIVPRGCVVSKVKDMGGWGNLAELDARILVYFVDGGGQPGQYELRGWPLIQPFGVRVDAYRMILRRRLDLLQEFLIRSNVKEVWEGTVISGFFPRSGRPVGEFWAELARICALVDSRLLAVSESISVNTDFGVVSDCFEVSSEMVVAGFEVLARRLDSVLDLSGALPSWRNVNWAFRFYSGGFDFLSEALMDLDSDERREVFVRYFHELEAARSILLRFL